MKKIISIFILAIFLFQPLSASSQELILPERETIEAYNPELNIDELIEALPEGASLEDPYLWLVNRDNRITDPTEMPLAYTGGGIPYSAEIVEPFEALITGAELDGHYLYAVSGYRSVAQQAANFEARLNLNMSEGLDYDTAYYYTDMFVAPADASEHSTGLAIDLLGYDWDQYGGDLHQAYGQYPSAIWLAEEGDEYGFIVRYLDGKQDITGYEYEPWHFRYVGAEHAQFMNDYNLVLEEYLALIQMRDEAQSE